jgi:SAM-dependent methyltransferase
MKLKFMKSNQYFSLRNVDPKDYRNFKIPVYLSNILNDDKSKILDFGCGFGQFISAFRQRGFSQIEGADIDEAAIQHGQDQGYIIHDLRKDSSLYEKNQEIYDYVLMSHVLEHFPKEEIIPQLVKIRGLLKRTGALIVMVPNAQSNTGCYWAYEDFTHFTLFTSGSLYHVLQAAGYSKVSFIDPDCTAGLSWPKSVLKRLLLSFYQFNINFWNRVTGSAFHKASPQIFSYEIKCLARR